MSRAAFPTPYAGSYYPIYGEGTNQYIPPTTSMPFDKVSALFVAFAHAYPVGETTAAELLLEKSQPDEPDRLPLLTSVARAVNPAIKILLTLGWEHDDWTYISNDLTSGSNNFPASVVALLRQYGLDGFDIDDEDINGSSGTITQEDFDQVILNLRSALDEAGAADGKPYYLTIAPAFGKAQVDAQNMGCFDLINAQCYGSAYPDDFTELDYPRNQIAWGIDTERADPGYPSPEQYQGLAGIFNWTMSADSADGFPYTQKIAADVGYPPQD